MAIKRGDKVKVLYEGTLDDGTVFDSSDKHEQPLQFEVGAGQIIKGFENATVGMIIGEEKVIKLQPTEAYGGYKPDLVKKVARNSLPKEEIKKGMTLLISTTSGGLVPAKIMDVNKEEVIIDLNHPLAGKTLNFKIKIVDASA
ncbi:peptidylprolyl isomerase [Candidatus Woesearchaeota archaeon]|nr:peptidylprolyl isomerase [Candidatus Woesearchaeota archaeon]